MIGYANMKQVFYVCDFMIIVIGTGHLFLFVYIIQ